MVRAERQGKGGAWEGPAHRLVNARRLARIPEKDAAAMSSLPS